MTSLPPKHIAIIMDGNGRWARDRGLPRREGHRAGAESVREAVEACKELGTRYLTLYAFSTENWKRPKAEVSSLMLLLERFLKQRLRDLHFQDVRLHAIGRLSLLPGKTRRLLEKTIEATKDNSSLDLVLALSYGSREEITDTARALALQAKEGFLEPDSITPETISRNLYTRDFPDPDLLIRTSGELRLSNFLLWQLSYAEMIVSPKFWPDFRKADLHQAVSDYRKRQRRFGSL